MQLCFSSLTTCIREKLCLRRAEPNEWKQIFDGIGLPNVPWPRKDHAALSTSDQIKLNESIKTRRCSISTDNNNVINHNNNNNNLENISLPSGAVCLPVAENARSAPNDLNTVVVCSIESATAGLTVNHPSPIIASSCSAIIPDLNIATPINGGSTGGSTQPREYKCFFCDKTFSRRYRRDTHVR